MGRSLLNFLAPAARTPLQAGAMCLSENSLSPRLSPWRLPFASLLLREVQSNDSARVLPCASGPRALRLQRAEVHQREAEIRCYHGQAEPIVINCVPRAIRESTISRIAAPQTQQLQWSICFLGFLFGNKLSVERA